jgi:hypothetical protein
MDIDVLVMAKESELARLAKSLTERGLKTETNSLCHAWRSKYRIATVSDSKSSHTLDVIFIQCGVSLDWKSEAFMVRSDAEDRVSMFGRLPAEEAFIEADRWLLNRVGDFASLPSVPLGFLDELAGSAVGLVLRVEEMVESSVAVRLLTFDRVKCGRCKSLEDTVRVLEFAVLAVREWQYLLRRYLPQQGNVAPTTSMAEQGVSAFLSNLRALLTFSRN